VNYEVVFSRQAQQDAKKLKRSNLKRKALKLIQLLRENPFQTPPRLESLTGDLTGCYSRRININHRIVYEVFEDKNVVLVLRMWTHYGD
jgi:toxin YoeB